MRVDRTATKAIEIYKTSTFYTKSHYISESCRDYYTIQIILTCIEGCIVGWDDGWELGCVDGSDDGCSLG